MFACEILKQCQNELLWQAEPPQHLFGDILEIMPPDLERQVARIPPCENETLRSRILSTPLRRSAWCIRCCKDCPVTRAHCNVSGVPCVDHSRRGTRSGFKGHSNIVFYVWCRQRIDLKEPVWVLENVEEFGVDEVGRCLGRFYEIESLTLSPVEVGWASKRKRIFIVGKLRGINLCPPGVICTDSIKNGVDMFRRAFCFNQTAYDIATPEEINSELAWAASRKKVRERHAPSSAGDDVLLTRVKVEFNADELGSFERAMTARERLRLVAYIKLTPGAAVDLGQDVQYRAHSARDGHLHTLIKGMGLTWKPWLRRWYSQSELLTAMGFPIDDDSVRRAGQVCSFSRNVPYPTNPRRSRSSVCQAVGNTMHITCIGAVVMAAWFTWPAWPSMDQGPRAPSEPHDDPDANDDVKQAMRRLRRRLGSGVD